MQLRAKFSPSYRKQRRFPLLYIVPFVPDPLGHGFGGKKDDLIQVASVSNKFFSELLSVSSKLLALPQA